MNTEFQRYRFARIEGHNITRARLEAQFQGGITDLDELEKLLHSSSQQHLRAVLRGASQKSRKPVAKMGYSLRLSSFSGRTV